VNAELELNTPCVDKIFTIITGADCAQHGSGNDFPKAGTGPGTAARRHRYSGVQTSTQLGKQSSIRQIERRIDNFHCYWLAVAQRCQ
jgi:hypothetical protein